MMLICQTAKLLPLKSQHGFLCLNPIALMILHIRHTEAHANVTIKSQIMNMNPWKEKKCVAGLPATLTCKDAEDVPFIKCIFTYKGKAMVTLITQKGKNGFWLTYNWMIEMN